MPNRPLAALAVTGAAALVLAAVLIVVGVRSWDDPKPMSSEYGGRQIVGFGLGLLAFFLVCLAAVGD